MKLAPIPSTKLRYWAFWGETIIEGDFPLSFGIDAATYPISRLKNDNVVCGGRGMSEDCSGSLEAGDTSADDGDGLLGGSDGHFAAMGATRSFPGSLFSGLSSALDCRLQWRVVRHQYD